MTVLITVVAITLLVSALCSLRHLRYRECRPMICAGPRNTTSAAAPGLLLIAALAACKEPVPAADTTHEDGHEPAAADAGAGPQQRTIYVPSYTSLRTTPKERTSFAITLSVRNVDPEANIALTRVDYFDSPGHKIRSFLTKRRRLRPLQTVEYFLEANETADEPGANFLVSWEGAADAHAPLAESIMIGFTSNGYVTFTSRGIQLDRAPQVAASPPVASASAAASSGADAGLVPSD